MKITTYADFAIKRLVQRGKMNKSIINKLINYYRKSYHYYCEHNYTDMGWESDIVLSHKNEYLVFLNMYSYLDRLKCIDYAENIVSSSKCQHCFLDEYISDLVLYSIIQFKGSMYLDIVIKLIDWSKSGFKDSFEIYSIFNGFDFFNIKEFSL